MNKLLFDNVDSCPKEYTKHGCLGLYKWSLLMFQPPSAIFPNPTFSLQYICVDVKYLKYKTITFNSHYSQEIMEQSWYELSRSYFNGVLYKSAFRKIREYIYHVHGTNIERNNYVIHHVQGTDV